METPKSPWSGPDGEEFVPTVDCEYLKRVFDFVRDIRRKNGACAIAMGPDGWERLLPGANINAVTYRNVMLEVLKHFTAQIAEHRSEVDPKLVAVADKLRERLSGDTFDDAVLAVMSRIPLRWIKSEGPQGFPFDIEQFLTEISRADLQKAGEL